LVVAGKLQRWEGEDEEWSLLALEVAHGLLQAHHILK